MNKTHYAFSFKITCCITSVSVACVVLFVRLMYLQVSLGDMFVTQSKKNFTRYEETVSLRGNILDSSGTILATNRPVTDVYWQGSGNRKLTDEQKAILKTIKTLIPLATDQEYANIQHAERYRKKILLSTDLSFEDLSKIIELFPNDPNIKLGTHFTRFYPYNALASHMLGYLGHLNSHYEGKTGIEKIFEEALRGKAGSIMRIINSLGTHLAEYEIEKTLQGNHIVTTLDLPLQKIAEEAFPPDIAGALIIMDPATGALRACVSRPTFDPNVFTAPLDQETWAEIQEKKPFLNRISNAAYPIGSIFKLITISAALETGVVEQHSSWNCPGYYTFVGRKYHCVRREGHGGITIKLALAHSCNIPFFDMGKKMDIDTISHYATLFGLGQPTTSILPEATGLVPSRAWKRRVKKERWWAGETLSATIGQTFLLATPLQIARMIGSIQTGYLVNPRIIESTPIETTPLPIKEDTRKFLQKAMHAAVTKGSACWLDRLHHKDFILYAKTSTAQTSSLDRLKDGKQFLEHSWLASNFIYKDNPPLTLVIITEYTGRTGIPVRIAYNLLREYKAVKDAQERNKKL